MSIHDNKLVEGFLLSQINVSRLKNLPNDPSIDKTYEISDAKITLKAQNSYLELTFNK